MVNIVPAVLVKSEAEFQERVSHEELYKLAPIWQVDVLDGSMYHAESWADGAKAAKSPMLPGIELHLMIQNPLPVIADWKEHVPSLKRAIIHVEIERPVGTVIDEIEKMGIETGLALNPETPLEDYTHHIDRVNVLLIMGVHPGSSGQAFLGEPVLRKIQKARILFPNKTIAVDGGVTEDNAKGLVTAGADQLCTASAIWAKSQPDQAFTAIQNLL